MEGKGDLEGLKAFDLVASVNGTAAVFPDREFSRSVLGDRSLYGASGDPSEELLGKFAEYARAEAAKAIRAAGYECDPSSFDIDDDSMFESIACEHDPKCVLRASGSKVVASVLAPDGRSAERALALLPASAFPGAPAQGSPGEPLFHGGDFSSEARESGDQSPEHKQEVLAGEARLPSGTAMAARGQPARHASGMRIDASRMDPAQMLKFCQAAVGEMTGREFAGAVNRFCMDNRYSASPVCRFDSGKIWCGYGEDVFGAEGDFGWYPLAKAKDLELHALDLCSAGKGNEEVLELFCQACIGALGQERSAAACGRLSISAAAPEGMKAAGDPSGWFFLKAPSVQVLRQPLDRLCAKGLAEPAPQLGGGMFRIDARALGIEPELFSSGAAAFKTFSDAKAGRKAQISEIAQAAGRAGEFEAALEARSGLEGGRGGQGNGRGL